MTSTAPRRAADLSQTGEFPGIRTSRCAGQRATVSVQGELDVATAAQLWSVLQEHLSSGRRFLRLDLSGVTFVDTAAVTAIVEVHHEALYRRGTLILEGVTAPVARVLALTGVDGTLFIAGPRAEADAPQHARSWFKPRDLLGSRAWPSPRR
jgi:anti-anti-sigma factor